MLRHSVTPRGRPHTHALALALAWPGTSLAQEPPDDDLEAELAEELAQMPNAREGSASDSASANGDGTSSAATSSTATGATATDASMQSASADNSNMNPAVSAALTVLGGFTTRRQEEADPTDPASFEEAHEHETGDLESGVFLQEVEVRLGSVVDPYFRADLTLTAHEDEIGFEEAYLSTLAIPSVTVRAGQLFANFGRHNLWHTHAFPFLTPPLPWRALLGADGLKDPAVSADILLPLPVFVELNLQALAGDWKPFAGEIEDDPNTAIDESVPDRRRTRDLAYLGHLKTLFELSDSATLEVGGSYVAGRNGYGRLSQVAGGDLTVKWRPVEAERYTGLDWTSEVVWVERRGAPEHVKSTGAYSGLRYQFAQRWWVQARGASLDLLNAAEHTLRGETLLAFVPTEFSLLRMQYAYETGDPLPDPVHEIYLQASVAIGAHPAHAY